MLYKLSIFQHKLSSKFGFNWSSSVRGEEFWKVVQDNRQWKTEDDGNGNDDDNGRQVMAMAHMAFGQVS